MAIGLIRILLFLWISLFPTPAIGFVSSEIWEAAMEELQNQTQRLPGTLSFQVVPTSEDDVTI